MQIKTVLQNNYLPDQYGKYATGENVYKNHPITNFPITIQDAPKSTVSFAVWLLDFDAVPVSGFPWIHWNAANLPGDLKEIPAGISHTDKLPIVEGNNSNAGPVVGQKDPQIARGYVGPQPPNADHAYTLFVFALDTKLDLRPGFWLNEARHAMAGHILAQASIDILSRK